MSARFSISVDYDTVAKSLFSRLYSSLILPLWLAYTTGYCSDLLYKFDISV